jgi:hypothetical protein
LTQILDAQQQKLARKEGVGIIIVIDGEIMGVLKGLHYS